MLKWLTKLFTKKTVQVTSDKVTQEKVEYTDFDYESLCELYYKNQWLRHETNSEGLKNLWFESESKPEKIVLKRLLNNFTYIKQEDAKSKTKKVLEDCIKNWKLSPNDTIFIAFKIEEFADGSSIALNFIRPILSDIDEDWRGEKFFGDIHRGKRRFGDVDLKNVVLVDDFVGTGGTAKNRIEYVRAEILRKNQNLNIFVYSLGGMIQGKKKIETCSIPYSTTYQVDKGTNLAFPSLFRPFSRFIITRMENNLSKGKGKITLEKFTLGYEKSEALYAWNIFNIPNNNYPIFWWNRYKGETKRTTLFNRSH